jgi:Leucine-rich repeat (LRR) protein
MEEDPFMRWNITSLINLDLSQNKITKIWQWAFYSLADLLSLNLNDNSITTLDYNTFFNNTRLYWLSLGRNSITEIHLSTFQTNDRLNYIYMSGNKITSLHPDLLNNNVELETVYVADNRITDIHPSTIRNNKRLRKLDISKNKITSIHPDTFVHNRELIILYLHGNKITEISNTLFRGLEHLEVLDRSNNKIEEINPLVFHNTLKSINRYIPKVSKLKRLNLAQNIIRSFNFELYFPISSNSDSSAPTFQLDYLNVSSNRLTTLNVASIKWLKHTTAVTDLTENPWNCDCSVIIEVWRELKHKQTLHFASPRQLQGKSWDVIEVFCSQPADEKPKNVEGISVLTTTFIVTGVLLVGAIGWGLFLAKAVKRRRNRAKTTEYCDVYGPRASHISLHSYEDVGAGPSHVTDQTYADVGIRPSYLSVQS